MLADHPGLGFLHAAMIPGPAHMPFLTSCPDGTPLLLMCRPGGGSPGGGVAWKLWARANGRTFQMVTHQPNEAVECSPAAWHDGTRWHVSFVAGGTTACRRFFLYEATGVTLASLGPPQRVHWTRAGFVRGDRVVRLASPSRVEVFERRTRRTFDLPKAVITRLSYRADAPDTLIVTGQSIDLVGAGAIFTLTYDLGSGSEAEVRSGGASVYKCTILGDRLIHAVQTGPGFEDRSLVAAESFELVASKRVVRVDEA
jgi:hypothetical protein